MFDSSQILNSIEEMLNFHDKDKDLSTSLKIHSWEDLLKPRIILT